MISLSRFLAFLYVSNFRRFLGFTVSTWLKLLPLGLTTLTLALRWPLWLVALWLLLFVLVFIVYGLASRTGYKRFVAETSMKPDPALAAPAPNEKLALRATGIFSLNDREDYVLEHPAEYWRVPLGQHIFMVRHRPGTFLYQVIKSEFIEKVEPGYLLFGAKPKRALALTFLVTWGPQYAEYKLYYVGTENAQPPNQRRTVYLTFTKEEDWQRMWHSLLTPKRQA